MPEQEHDQADGLVIEFPPVLTITISITMIILGLILGAEGTAVVFHLIFGGCAAYVVYTQWWNDIVDFFGDLLNRRFSDAPEVDDEHKGEESPSTGTVRPLGRANQDS